VPDTSRRCAGDARRVPRRALRTASLTPAAPRTPSQPPPPPPLQLAPAAHISFSPSAPHDYAVTTGTRVAVYDGKTNKEKRNLAKFKDVVHAARYRGDGALLAAGTSRGTVQVVDVSTKATLRTFKGHRGPVHVAQFAPGAPRVLSAGDDRSIRVWDMPTGEVVTAVEGAHDDYIRCAHTSPSTPHIWATGSYDHTVKLWDTRALMGSARSRRAAASAAAATTAAAPAEKSGNADNEEEGAAGDGDADVDAGDDDSEAEGSGAEGAAAKRIGADSDAESDGEEGGGDAESDSDDDDEDDDDSDEDDEEDDDDDEEEEEDAEMDTGAASSSAAAASSTAAPGASADSGAARGSSGARTQLGCLLTVNHGEPVTQVLLLPGGGSLLTSGGNSVKLWDIVSGGRLVHTFSHHQKLVTALTLDGTGSRLLTGGLDGLVKVYELATFTVTHTIRYDAPIVSLAVSPDNTRLVVGCTDGSLVVRQRKAKVAELVAEGKQARVLRGGSYRYFLRGQTAPAGPDDVRVETTRKARLAPYDAHLKAFSYRAALDAALLSRDPNVVASMLEELVARRGLAAALAGRDDASLEPVLAYLVKHVVDPRYASLLLDVANGERAGVGDDATWEAERVAGSRGK
jgi:hypothetical protein